MNRVVPQALERPVPVVTADRLLTQIRVLNVIYTHSCQDSVTAAERAALLQEVAEAERFFCANSRLNLDLEITNIIVDRYLSLNQFWLISSPGGYWLPQWSQDGVHSVEQDLRDLGYQDGDVGGVFVFYAWENTSSVYAALGGGTYGVGAILGSAAYSSVPLCWEPTASDWYFLHEFHHQIDSMFEACGHPEYAHADQPGSYDGHYDDGPSFNAWILSSCSDSAYRDLAAPWGRQRLVADRDGDALPDSGAGIPLTELLLQGNTRLRDTDHDGLDDGREACAGLWASADLNRSDTDGDGLLDGQDAYPLDSVRPFLRPRTPALDGAITPGEWDRIATFPGSSDLRAELYAQYDASYLYLAVHVEDDIIAAPWSDPWWDDGLYLRIDATNDGFLAHGQDNYDLWAIPFGTGSRPTFAVSVVMPDGSTNETLVAENDLLGAFTRGATEYTLELGIPANGQAGLHPEPGRVLGMMAEICDFDTYPGWPHLPLFTEFVDFDLYPTTDRAGESGAADAAEPTTLVAPQPVRPRSVVRYRLVRASEVTLSVYDVRGRRARVLDSGWRRAGEHAIVWPSEPWPSGVYWLRLDTGSSVPAVTRRVVVIR